MQDGEESELAPGRSSAWTTVKVEVPVEAVGAVIGRQGSNIKLIQDSTNTKIKFSVGGCLICFLAVLEFVVFFNFYTDTDTS